MLLWYYCAFTLSAKSYAIIVDCGSSGTRAHTYFWDKTLDVPVIQSPDAPDAHFDIDLKLADGAYNKTIINMISKEIITRCSAIIKSKYISSTTIFVYATAGVRLLPQDKQDDVMTGIFRNLRENSRFRVRRENVRVISGSEEGVFGWISVNYMLKKFDNEENTSASIDMGGASTEVAFEVSEKSENTIETKIGGVTHQVFSYSYLYYGASSALLTVNNAIYNKYSHKANKNKQNKMNAYQNKMNRLQESNLKNNMKNYMNDILKNKLENDESVVENPCYFKGYTLTFNDMQMIGTGDFDQCSKLIHDNLISAKNFSDVNVPSMNHVNNVYAISTYAYALSFLNISSNTSIEEFKSALLNISQLTIEEIYKKYENSGIPKKYIPTYFWESVYGISFLSDGLNLTDNDHTFDMPIEINGDEIGWALGAMISKVIDVQLIDSNRPLNLIIQIVNVSLFVIISIALVFYIKRWKKDSAAEVPLISP